MSKVGQVKLHPPLAASSGGTTHCKECLCVRWKTGHKVSFVLLFHKCFEPRGSVEDATPECKISHQSFLVPFWKGPEAGLRVHLYKSWPFISSMQLLIWMNRQMKHFFPLTLFFSSLQFRLNWKRFIIFTPAISLTCWIDGSKIRTRKNRKMRTPPPGGRLQENGCLWCFGTQNLQHL